jgi:exosome complex component RRP40
LKHDDGGMSIVFPGDIVSIATAPMDDAGRTPGAAAAAPRASKKRKTVHIGAGLEVDYDVRAPGTVRATRIGVLRSGATANRHWVDTPMRRYVPVAEDLVVGTVTDKHGEGYKVDIGAVEPAQLPAIAFQGATKRNRPTIAVGALVYCRVEVANKFMAATLTCVSPHVKKEWMTGEALFGQLSNGYAFKTSLSLARRLLAENAHVLKCIGEHIAFELAVGQNGKVWVDAGTPLRTILVSNAIINSEFLTPKKTATMCKRLASVL